MTLSAPDIETKFGLRFAQYAIGMTGALYHVVRLSDGAALLVDGRVYNLADGSPAWFSSMKEAREEAHKHNQSRQLMRWRLAR